MLSLRQRNDSVGCRLGSLIFDGQVWQKMRAVLPNLVGTIDALNQAWFPSMDSFALAPGQIQLNYGLISFNFCFRRGQSIHISRQCVGA